MATNGKYVVEQNMPAQQRAMVIGDGNTAWDSFFDAYQAASLKGDQAVFEVYGGEYNTSNFPEINIKANDSLRITADLLENGYKTTPFTITDIDFVNNGTVTIKRSILADADTDKTVTFTLASTTEKKLTFTNNSSLTVQNAAFIVDKVVNGEDAEIVLKNATFTVPVVENAGLVRITGGEFAATEFTGGGTVWIATTFNDTEITGDNNFIVKYATTLNDSSIEGTSLSVDLGNLTLNSGALAFDDVTIASGKYLFITGDENTIDFGSVTGTVSVKADAVLSDSTVSSGTVYFGKNTGLIGENAFDVIQVSGASKDATSDDYRKLTIGDDTAPTVDPETGDVTFATTLSATKIQLGSSTKYGNLDIKNASVDLETLNSANADNVVTVAGESDLTIGNLTGSINLANGADVTATVTDAAEGAAFNVGTTTTFTYDPEVLPIVKNKAGSAEQIETKETFADVAQFAGNASSVDVNVAGGTLNVLGTAFVDDVETSVVNTTTTVTGTTYSWTKAGVVSEVGEKTVYSKKAKNLTGTVNVGTKDGKTEASLTAGDITNAGAFNVYGKATLVADDIANAGTLNFAKGSFIAVDDIEGDAENKTGTVSIASEIAVISSITDQKSVSIASGANLTGVKAISENTAVTITAASVEVNELLDNGTVTIGKGESTLTVEEFAGTITMADGAILSDSEIGAANPESIEETENSIYVGSRSSKIANMQVEGHPKNVTSYDSNVATFAGDSIAAADLVIDSGIANVTGELVVDDIETLANTGTNAKKNVSFVEDADDPSGSGYAKKEKSLVSTLNIAAASADDDAALVEAHDIINAGAINVGTKAGLGSLDAADFTNNGTVTVAAGSMLDTESFTNTKTLTLNGEGDLDDVTNSGTVTVAATTGFLDADDIENSGTFNVKGELEADKLTNKTTSNKKFEVTDTGLATIGEVENEGLINVFGHLNVGTFEEPAEEGGEPVFEGGTLENIGEIWVGNPSASVGGYLNAGDIFNGKFAEGEEGEEGYEPADAGAITVGWTGEVQPEQAVISGLFADSITNYVGTISVEIGSYLDADTITNYDTITVDSLGAGNASSETAGRLYANSILNKEGATLNLAGVLGSIAEDDAQVLTITAEVGSEVNFARWTTAENVKIVGGGTINLGNQFHYNTLVLSGASLTSSGNFYTVGEDTSITIDAASSIKTNSFGADDTIIFDATNIDSIAEEDIKWTLVNADVSAVTLMVKLAEGAELVEVTDNLQINDDYTIVKRDDKITLTTQTTSKIYVNQEWNQYEIGYGFTWDIVNSDGTVTPTELTYGFNAFGEFSDITYPTYAAEMPPKVPAARNVFLNAGTYNPENEGKKYFFYTSDRDVVFDVNPILNPENPENDNYTVTLDTDRTYLMKPVNYSKVQTGYVDPEAEVLVPVYEYTVTDKDGNAITSAEQAPTFTIAENMVLTTGLLKAGDKLDDADTENKSDWSAVAPAEGEEFPTFEPKRSGGVANLVIDGTVNAIIYTAPFSTVTISETGSTKNTAAAWSSSNNICVNASVAINGGKDTKTAEGYQAEVANVAFLDGGSLTINDSKVKISQIRYERLNGGDPIGVLEPTAASITLNNTVLETVTDYTGFGNGDTKDQAVFFIPGINPASGYDKDEKISKLDVTIENKSNVVIQADFNPSEVTTVTISDSTLKANKLTNNGTIIATSSVIENKHDAGSLFTNNGEITLDDSVINHTWDYIYNYGTITATNDSVITGNIHNASTYIAAEDITIGSTLLVQDSTIAVDAEGGSGYFYNWWGSTVLVEDSVVSFTTLANEGSFTVTGESSLSANWFQGKVELVSATLTDSDIATTENAGYLNIAANVPNDDPEAEPEANEVTFAGGNVINATIENAGTANFTTTGDAVNAIATFNNAEDATLAISGNLTKAGENEASIKNDGTASATGATIDYVMLNNNGEFTLSGTSLTSNSSSAVWNKGTFSVLAHSTLDATILNQGNGSVTIDASTINKEIKNNSATGTVTVTGSSEIAAVTNDGTFSMTSSNATGDITNNKTFTANGGSITGNITNAANATFTMENGAKFVGAVKNPDNSYTEYSITNNGTFNLSNAKITELRSNRSKGATINNTNGTFIVSGSDFEITAKSITTASGDVKKFNVSGTGKLDVVELSGRIRIDGDTTLNSAAIDNGADGELYVASGKTLTLKADSTFKNTLITNNGTIKAEKALSTKLDNNNIGALDNKNNATVNVTGDMTVGTVTNAGTINASDNVTTGQFTNNDGKTFKATGSGKTVTVNGALSNSGTFDVTGNLATNGNAITNVKNTMTVGGTLKTTKSGAASGNVTITAGSITATGAMEVGDVTNNGGTLTAKNGLKAGAVTNADGKTIAVTGALNTTGKITNSGSLTADSVATNGKDIENVKNTFTVNGALNTTKSGAASGAVTVTAGTVSISGAATVGALGNSGTFKAASLTAGAVTVTKGTVDISGAATVGALGVGDANSGTFKAASLKADDVTVTKGTVTISGAAKTKAITNSGTFSAASIDTQGKAITNNANATITVNGDLTTKKDTTYGAVTNSGTFTVDGNVTIGAFTSEGGNFSIKAKADKSVTMTVNGKFSNTGTLTIDVTAISGIAVGEQVQVVSVTGDVLTSVGNIALDGTDKLSFKKIIQTTGDKKGIYLYKTDEVVSAPTIYVNGAWNTKSAGDQIEFPEGSQTPLTFGLDAFAGTNTLDLASDTTTLNIVYSGGYDALNITQSLDVAIWNSTGTSPAAQSQVFAGLSVSGNKTVANFCGQKIMTTGATIIGAGNTLDLSSSPALDRDPSTLSTGAIAELKDVSGTGTIKTDWNSELTFVGACGTDFKLDVDVTGYNGGGKTFATGYSTEENYRLIVKDNAKFDKYFVVEGSALKMNAQARETIYVSSSSAYDIANAIDYTWGPNNEYHADNIVILGGNYAEVLSLKGIGGQTITVEAGNFTKSVYGGNIVEGTGTGRVVADVTGNINIEVNGGSFKNLVAGDNIKTKAIYSRTGNINLSISGTASFTSVVAAGMMCQLDAGGSLIELVGNTNLTISGGSFAKTVFGGMFATKLNSSGNTYLDGTANVTVVGGDDKITFGDGLCVGSYGYGGISKGTALTLTGNAEMITFTGTGTDIWGGCSGDYYTTEGKYESSMDTGAKRTLTFSGFEGNFAGCDSINGFSDVFVKDATDVVLSKGINLKHVDNWTFECGSTLAGAFTNDLTKDTLTLKDYTNLKASETWTLFGADVDLQGVNAQMNVYFGETKVAYDTTAQGWVSGEYTLKYTEDDGLFLKNTAVLA